MSFETLVKQRICEHEFHPICIEATNRKKIVARSFKKWREKNYDEWNERLKEWRANNKEHIREYYKEYRARVRDSEEWKAYRKRSRDRYKRKRKINALWELMTYDGQRKN